jgi:hypothetical protein
MKIEVKWDGELSFFTKAAHHQEVRDQEINQVMAIELMTAVCMELR